MILAESISISGELLLLALVVFLLLVAAALAYVLIGARIVARAVAEGGRRRVTAAAMFAVTDGFLALLGVANWRDGGVFYLVPGAVHLVAAAVGRRRRRPPTPHRPA